MTFVSRVTVLFCFVALFTHTSFSQETKGKKNDALEVTLYGEIIDSKCYMENIMGGGRGKGHKACALQCAKSGIPLAFLEEKTEKVYFLTRLNKLGSVNEMLLPFVAERVALTGKLIERGSTQMIMIDMVEKIAD